MLCIETPGVSRKNATPLCLHIDIKTGMSTIICPLPFQIREFRYYIVRIFSCGMLCFLMFIKFFFLAF